MREFFLYTIANKRSLLILSGALMVMACSSPKDSKNTMLSGEYEVVSAKRNGKLTETLNQARFDFRKDSTLITDLYGAEDTFAITYNDDHSFSHPVDQQNINYMVKSASKDTLVLTTEIRNYIFEMVLIPKREQAQVTE